MEFDNTKKVGVRYEIKEGGIEYNFRPVDRNSNELVGVSLCLVYKLDNKEILVIRRSYSEKLYPGYYSVPAGHMGVYENGRCETPEETALRELYEETKLTPKRHKQIFTDRIFIDKNTNLIGFLFLCVVDDDSRPEYNSEIIPEESGFKSLEDIMKLLAKEENFTPPSKRILEALFEEVKKYGSLDNYLNSI